MSTRNRLPASQPANQPACRFISLKESEVEDLLDVTFRFPVSSPLSTTIAYRLAYMTGTPSRLPIGGEWPQGKNKTT